MSAKKTTKALVQCALFLAIGLMLRNFSYMVYMGGGAGMRLGISGFFTKMPALLFGPLYGALVSGITDLLGYVIKPDGAYIFPITLTAACGGVITGLIFGAVKGKSTRSLKRIYLVITALIGLAGIFNHISILFHPNGMWGRFLLGMDKKTTFFTLGAYIACSIGFLFYAVNTFLEKKIKAEFMNVYMHIFITFLISDVLVTTANTFILMAFIPALAKLGFMTFYLPRFAQEIVSVFISSYFVAYLYDLYGKINSKI